MRVQALNNSSMALCEMYRLICTYCANNLFSLRKQIYESIFSQAHPPQPPPFALFFSLPLPLFYRSLTQRLPSIFFSPSDMLYYCNTAVTLRLELLPKKKPLLKSGTYFISTQQQQQNKCNQSNLLFKMASKALRRKRVK